MKERLPDLALLKVECDLPDALVSGDGIQGVLRRPLPKRRRRGGRTGPGHCPDSDRQSGRPLWRQSRSPTFIVGGRAMASQYSRCTDGRVAGSGSVVGDPRKRVADAERFPLQYRTHGGGAPYHMLAEIVQKGRAVGRDNALQFSSAKEWKLVVARTAGIGRRICPVRLRPDETSSHS